MLAVAVVALIAGVGRWGYRLNECRKDRLSWAAVHERFAKDYRQRMSKRLVPDPAGAEKDRQWADWHARTATAIRKAADRPWDTTPVPIRRPPPR